MTSHHLIANSSLFYDETLRHYRKNVQNCSGLILIRFCWDFILDVLSRQWVSLLFRTQCI